MKKITKGLYLLLAVVMCLTVVQPVNAKTKYLSLIHISEPTRP